MLHQYMLQADSCQSYVFLPLTVALAWLAMFLHDLCLRTACTAAWCSSEAAQGPEPLLHTIDL